MYCIVKKIKLNCSHLKTEPHNYITLINGQIKATITAIADETNPELRKYYFQIIYSNDLRCNAISNMQTSLFVCSSNLKYKIYM